MSNLIHLDLFSGIGGFAYAIDQVWDNVEHIFCDNEPFAQQVLKKHWKDSYIYGDIRTITADSYVGRHIHREPSQQPAERSHETLGEPEPGVRASGIQLLTGGFPCQPFSAAGLRRGTADDRHLWPEMLRVIRLTKPEWVIAENVGGLITWDDGLVLEQVCADLEAAGYEVQPFIIPAVAINAPHRRDRVWFVAYRDDTGSGTPTSETSQNRQAIGEEWQHAQYGVGRQGGDTSHAGRTSGGEGRSQSPQRETSERGAAAEEDKRLGRIEWDKDWMEIAAEFCSVDDGLPVSLDGFELSKSQHRKEQLKAYGNAIVPQVAIEIMRAIKSV